MENYRFPKL